MVPAIHHSIPNLNLTISPCVTNRVSETANRIITTAPGRVALHVGNRRRRRTGPYFAPKFYNRTRRGGIAKALRPGRRRAMDRPPQA